MALEETKQNTVEITKANEQKESNDVSKENFSMPELSDIKEEKKEEPKVERKVERVVYKRTPQAKTNITVIRGTQRSEVSVKDEPAVIRK